MSGEYSSGTGNERLWYLVFGGAIGCFFCCSLSLARYGFTAENSIESPARPTEVPGTRTLQDLPERRTPEALLGVCGSGEIGVVLSDYTPPTVLSACVHNKALSIPACVEGAHLSEEPVASFDLGEVEKGEPVCISVITTVRR